jgi:hypothetical protein
MPAAVSSVSVIVGVLEHRNDHVSKAPTIGCCDEFAPNIDSAPPVLRAVIRCRMVTTSGLESIAQPNPPNTESSQRSDPEPIVGQPSANSAAGIAPLDWCGESVERIPRHQA